MKKKLIAGIILIIMILPMFLNCYKVEAFSGELDPEYYISLPFIIWIEDEVGTGTISLSSSASGYSISYQKVDLTEKVFNSIQNKSKETNDYIEESNNILEEKRVNVQTLQTELNNLKDSDTATTEQITEAENKYNEAYDDYKEFYDTVKAKSNTLKNEYYALIPEYSDLWTETTNTEDNVKLDFKDYSGTIHFVLWAKITNGTNTYYDMNIYSPTIEKEENITINKTSASIKVDETIQLTATSSTDSEITWTSSDETIATVSDQGLVKGIKEGTAVITAKGSKKTAICTVTIGPKETTDGEWTDFSNAKFELKKDGISGAILEISDVTPKSESEYYLFITFNNSKPNVTSTDYNNRLIMTYDGNSKMFKTNESSKLAKYVELNQDLYVTILEKQSYESEKVVIYGKKLKRYEEAKYSDAFFATFMTDEADQLITTFTHNKDNNRKIQIKIGKITDLSILQKIKNKDASGFASLLSFAKSNNGIYNEIVSADKDDYYSIEYNAGEGETTGQSVISLKNLEDEAYYFLYIQTEDENGKYISNEAVTLAQADVHENSSWSLFFYGTEDFKWADFGDAKKEDNTKAPVKLPNTGKVTLISILIVTVVAGVVSFIKTKKYKGI